MRIRWKGPVAAALFVALGVFVLALVVPWQTAPLPTETTFSILDRPQTAADRAAIKAYRGEQPVALDDARLLGTDDLGNRYLISAKDDELCLIVLESAEASSFACDQAEEVELRGIWAELGDGTTFRLALVTPDAYSTASVQSTARQILRNENLLVFDSHGDGADSVTVQGGRYEDLSVSTR